MKSGARRSLLTLVLVGALACAACSVTSSEDEGYLDPKSSRIATDAVGYAAGRLQHLLRTSEVPATPSEVEPLDAYMYSDDRRPGVSTVYWEIKQRSTGPDFTVRYDLTTYYATDWDDTQGRTAWGRACGIITVTLADDPTRSTVTSEVVDCPDGTPARPTQ